MNKVLIVNANYYKKISFNLIKSAEAILKEKKIKFSLIEVPGIFEIPVTIKKNIKNFDAFVALGCVIKGETPHFDLICRSTFNAIMDISVEYSKPVGNGIITSHNMNQAIERSSDEVDSAKSNKGLEAVKAVISVLNNEPKSR